MRAIFNLTTMRSHFHDEDYSIYAEDEEDESEDDLES